MLHLFPSISVTKVSVIYFVFIILKPFLKEVLPVEQQTFSHVFSANHWSSVVLQSFKFLHTYSKLNCLETVE